MFVARRGGLLRANRSLEIGDNVEQIANQADICDLKYRCFLILVDCNDSPSILDSGEMLNSARNTDRDVKFGGNDLSGLADLHFIRHVAGINRGS